MSKKVVPKKKQKRICDPAMCDHCIYLGEGDFVCTLHGLDPDNTVFVLDEWSPTEFYMQCERKRKNIKTKKEGNKT